MLTSKRNSINSKSTWNELVIHFKTLRVALLGHRNYEHQQKRKKKIQKRTYLFFSTLSFLFHINRTKTKQHAKFRQKFLLYANNYESSIKNTFEHYYSKCRTCERCKDNAAGECFSEQKLFIVF